MKTSVCISGRENSIHAVGGGGGVGVVLVQGLPRNNPECHYWCLTLVRFMLYVYMDMSIYMHVYMFMYAHKKYIQFQKMKMKPSSGGRAPL